MTLPVAPALETETFELFGQAIQIHALTRTQALGLTGHESDLSEVEALVIAAATDTPVEDVRAWLATVTAGAVQPLFVRITELSGMVVTGPFQP